MQRVAALRLAGHLSIPGSGAGRRLCRLWPTPRQNLWGASDLAARQALAWHQARGSASEQPTKFDLVINLKHAEPSSFTSAIAQVALGFLQFLQFLQPTKAD